MYGWNKVTLHTCWRLQVKRVKTWPHRYHMKRHHFITDIKRKSYCLFVIWREYSVVSLFLSFLIQYKFCWFLLHPDNRNSAIPKERFKPKRRASVTKPSTQNAPLLSVRRGNRIKTAAAWWESSRLVERVPVITNDTFDVFEDDVEMCPPPPPPLSPPKRKKLAQNTERKRTLPVI